MHHWELGQENDSTGDASNGWMDGWMIIMKRWSIDGYWPPAVQIMVKEVTQSVMKRGTRSFISPRESDAFYSTVFFSGHLNMLLTGGRIVFGSVDGVIIIRVPICGRLVGDLLFDTFWDYLRCSVRTYYPTVLALKALHDQQQPRSAWTDCGH